MSNNNLNETISDEISKSENKTGCINKNITLFGDSITDVNVNGLWVNEIKKILEFKSLTNYARGYCTWCNKSDTEYNSTDTSNENIGNNVIWNQFNRLKKDVDQGIVVIPEVIVILAGTNDAIQEKPLGDSSTIFGTSIIDKNPKEVLTIAGAIRYGCESIRKEYPYCKIILATPIQIGDATRNAYVLRVHDTIIQCANLLSCEIMDQTYEAGINSYQEINDDVFLCEDGTHPNSDGGIRIANYIANQLKQKLSY